MRTDLIQLQEYGTLIVINQEQQIAGISANALAFTRNKTDNFLHRHIHEYLESCDWDFASKVIQTIEEMFQNTETRRVLLHSIKNQHYYFRLTLKDDYLYIEWEKQDKKHISATKLNKLSFLFEPSYPNDWETICRGLNNILRMDRICVLQIQENGNSKIIAEHSKADIQKLKDWEISKNFFSPHIKAYFNNYSYRYSEHISKHEQRFFSIDENIDLNNSLLKPIPEMHQLFYDKLNVKTALFFPLYIKREFWGLVIAQHEKKKPIDLQKRKLCTFIIQNVMNKYENYLNQKKLDLEHQLQDVRTLLLQRLTQSQSLSTGLIDSLDLLCSMSKSNGISLYNQGEIYRYGDTPRLYQIHNIIDYLQNKNTSKIYQDNSFKVKYRRKFKEELPIAGILTYTLNLDKNFYLLWFRNESVKSIIHIYKNEEHAYRAAELKLWEKRTKNTAIPWTENELHFVQMLKDVIDESIIHRARENEILQDELMSINNELEMFTYTLSHDLKNPL